MTQGLDKGPILVTGASGGIGGATVRQLVAAGADQAFDIGLHDQLQNGLGDDAQEVALIVLGQKLGQVHVGLGHRGLRKVRG